MDVRWQEQALIDLDEALAHISQDNPIAAIELVTSILTSVEHNLGAHPGIGRPGRVPGTREWVAHHSYIVAYRIEGEEILVLSVMHSSRLWPSAF